MKPVKYIEGFSKLSRTGRTDYLSSLTPDTQATGALLDSFCPADENFLKKFLEFSENTVSAYHLPFGVAPNFLINGRVYHIPMVIEESSVVAAASNAAKFWWKRGGFRTRVLSAVKAGQVHFFSDAPPSALLSLNSKLERILMDRVRPLTARMMERGGGVLSARIVDSREHLPRYYQLDVRFDTVDSMGANFINSCLEEMAIGLTEFFGKELPGNSVEVIMSILSNYVPECLVEASLEAPVADLEGVHPDISPVDFVRRFSLAVAIARQNVNRAVTHNKGIMNGVDAVVIATGNDFRAVEAGVHAYASRTGHYKSLTRMEQSEGVFKYTLTLPLSLGTVGGLTALHPLSAFSLELLGNPDAGELMQIAAAAGLANNFSAVRALVTWGIQKGHMMMHLSNILNTLDATDDEKNAARSHFNGLKVSYSAVEQFVKNIRHA
jgi:hydroxymethylglutaryl-CoA reductase